MDPQQEIFMTVRKTIKELGYDVYDGIMPDEKTPYPFVFLGETNQTDDLNKSAIFGNVTLSVDVWVSSPKQRGTLSEMALKVKQECFKLQKTKNFNISCKLGNEFVRPDTSTKQVLMRAHLDLEFKFY